MLWQVVEFSWILIWVRWKTTFKFCLNVCAQPLFLQRCLKYRILALRQKRWVSLWERRVWILLNSNHLVFIYKPFIIGFQLIANLLNLFFFLESYEIHVRFLRWYIDIVFLHSLTVALQVQGLVNMPPFLQWSSCRDYIDLGSSTAPSHPFLPIFVMVTNQPSSPQGVILWT